MSDLSEQSDQDERVTPWNVREATLDIGLHAARDLGHWQEALEFNAEQIRSMQARGAPSFEVASTRLKDYGSLLRLGKLAATEQLLLACRKTFEAVGDLKRLGTTFSAQADLEATRGHPGEAIRLQEIALRYSYAALDPSRTAVGHNNLANYLQLSGHDPALVVAHRLAAALIHWGTGSARLTVLLDRLARDLTGAGDSVPLPALPGSLADLCERVGQVKGVRLADLIARLPQQANDHVLAELIQLAGTPGMSKR
jgi:hypothetical protein